MIPIKPSAEEVVAAVHGKAPHIDRYMEHEEELRNRTNQLWREDEAEYQSLFPHNTTAASPSDPVLSVAAEAEVLNWTMSKPGDRYFIWRWRGVLVVTLPDSFAPRKRMGLDNLNSAGTGGTDLSDNELREFQLILADVGVKPDPEMPGLGSFDLGPRVAAGEDARAEGRYWQDGDITHRKLLSGSLVYPVILEPMVAPATRAAAPSAEPPRSGGKGKRK